MIILIDTEKHWQSRTLFHGKNTQESRHRREIPQSDEGQLIYKQTANILNGKGWMLPPNIRN